jgi:hypothetical protein
MGNTKIEFFIIRTFEDLVFIRKDFGPQHIAELLDWVSSFQSRIKFEKEFGGDGTEASVVYGDSTYSSQWAGGISKLTRFEVMYSDEDEPRGYQTMEEINEEFLKRSLNKNSI